MKSLFLTDCGKVRNHNEDAGGVFYNSSGQLLAVIADGMGGHNAGDIASQLTIDLFEKKWRNIGRKDFTEPQQFEQWIHNMIIDINRIIYDESKEKQELKGMGTTVVAVICTDDFITVAHIGDSRCYIYDCYGFKQLTKDHSLVGELLRVGQIKEEEAEEHPRKNVLLKALGTEEMIKPEIQTFAWEEGNYLLLCSDGLSNKVSHDELEQMIHSENVLENIGQELIELANHRGGEDNISLILIHHDGNREEGELEC